MIKGLNKWENMVLEELSSQSFQGAPLIDYVQGLYVEKGLSNQQIANALTKMCWDGKVSLSDDATSTSTSYDILIVAHYQDLHEREPERRKLGDRIRHLREEKGWSQQDLADKAEMTRANVNRIEGGKYSTGQDILSKIAAALGKKLDIV